MKRKVTSFPRATSCPASTAAPLPLPPVETRDNNTDSSSISQEAANRAQDARAIQAPHPFTQDLLCHVDEFRRQLPLVGGGVEACSVRDGLVVLTMRAGDPLGFGCRRWEVAIGGASYEGDPVSVRFTSPISLPGVDDTGRVSGLFLDIVDEPLVSGVASAAVLCTLSTRLASLLRGELVLAPYAPAHFASLFASAQQHSAAKCLVAETYRTASLTSELLDNAATGATLEDARLRSEWLQPPFAKLLEGGSVDWLLEASEVSPGIFSLPLFTPAFCALLLSEAAHFEKSDLPRRRPNTMNNYGLVLGEVGMQGLMTHLLECVVAPASAALFPLEVFCGPSAALGGLDHHHSFVVQYRAKLPGEAVSTGDEGLDMHQDSSETTLNVCLGSGDFTYGGLVFCGRTGDPGFRGHQYSHQQRPGEALLHLGRHRHGAAKMTHGERCNLIMWARSSGFRAAAVSGLVLPDGYPRSREHVEGIDRVCLSAANDEDYRQRLAAFL